MKELTSEQYLAIGREVGRAWANAGYTEDCGALDMGRAAYAASFPHAVAEALEEFTDAEWSYISSVAKPLKPRDKDYPRNRADVALSRRVTALTTKPDAAVEAVGKVLADLGIGVKVDDINDATLHKIVAAVDAARAKEAK